MLQRVGRRGVGLAVVLLLGGVAGGWYLAGGGSPMAAAQAAYDRGDEPGTVGAFANAAKYFAAEAGHRACETAVLTHGGMGYAREFHVERFFREIQIARIAPISGQLILSHIAERVLGLPKSY